MTSRDFCFWLQGYFEIGNRQAQGLDIDQVEIVKRHLALVFKHEIDPSAGPPEHQAALDVIHVGDKNPTGASTSKVTIGGVDPVTGAVFRC